MNAALHYTINVGGKLMDLSQPRIMGILNVTPDSFFADSRKQDTMAVRQRVEQMLAEGSEIIDIGAYSTRPGATEVSAEEELARLRMGMDAIHDVAPDAIVSVDTFRADVARIAVQEMGVHIINDIAGGDADPEMFATVAQLGVPYILTHNEVLKEGADLMASVLQFFGRRVQQLHELGAKDIILDPGFGFNKTLEDNYHLLRHMSDLHTLQLPILVGISRKSMIHRLLGITPQEALNGTTVLHTLSLERGAAILRVHDVRECAETIRIFKKMQEC